MPYDPGLAKNLLEEAGWHDVNGDGIRERDGEEFTFSAMVQMRWEAAISGVVNDLFSSKGLLYFCGEDSPLGFYKPQIIKRLDTIKNTMKRDEIDAVFRELRPIFQAELPWTFLTFDVETYVTHRRIQGLSTPFRANPVFHLEHLWIEEDDKKSEEKNGKKK